MSTFRVVMLVVCLATVSMNAQEAPSATLQSNRVHEITTQADYAGTNGALLLESPATSVLLKALGASMPITFETNGNERMRIFATGNVSIGGTTNDARLAIFDYADAGRGLSILHRATVEANITQIEYGVYVTSTADVAAGVTNLGTVQGGVFEAFNAGPGTQGGGIGVRSVVANTGGGTMNAAFGFHSQVGSAATGAGTLTSGYGIVIADVLATNDYGVYQFGANDTNFFAGDLGIGTNAPAQKLHLVGNAAITNTDPASSSTLYFNTITSGQGGAITSMDTDYTAQPNTANAAGTFAIMAYEAGGLSLTSSNATGGNVRIYTAGSGPGNERMRVVANGNVGIGTQTPTAKLHVQGGDIYASGNISAGGTIFAKYQDVAEWVPSTTDLVPGTVVVLNPEKDNEVMASAHSYDTAVAGVVSAQPGLVLGVGSDTKEQIATSGRVLVRVDARNAAVRVGDLLVTSDMPGTAMRSQPIDLGGHKIHQPGTIIGKALQPLQGGVGEILVLLSMQ